MSPFPHLIPSSPIWLLLIVGSATSWILFLRGYQDYLSTGPGGFGQSYIGYIRCLFIKYLLKFHRVDYGDRKLLEVEGERDSRRWLSEEHVPERIGDRPFLCDYPTPQRHIVQTPNEKLAARQLEFFKSLAEKYPKLLAYGCSSIERIGPAIFAHPDFDEEKGGSLWLRATRREIMHIHLSPFGFPTAPLPTPDPNAIPPRTVRPYEPLNPAPAPQSLHLLLSPLDADLILRKQWGVRHAASGHPPFPLVSMPPGFVLLYAPQDDLEMSIFEKICQASVGFSVGAELPKTGKLRDGSIYSR